MGENKKFRMIVRNLGVQKPFGSDGVGYRTCYCFVSLKRDLRKSAWQAVRLVVKSDIYPPLDSCDLLAA
jgi:hypothetical protein